MIPGSVPASAFEADMTMGEGKTIVTYCTVGGRSGGYARKLLAAEGPWKEVLNFELSIIGWAHAGGDMVDPSGAVTKKVHPGGPLWAGCFPVGYETVMEP